MEQLIKKVETEGKANPLRSIFSYGHKDQQVYYLPAFCCDQHGDFYVGECKLIEHPDGGFDGKGDSGLPDFNTAKTPKTDSER